MFVRFVCAIVCPYAFVFPFVPSRLPTISLGEDALRAWFPTRPRNIGSRSSAIDDADTTSIPPLCTRAPPWRRRHIHR